ncbi:MAG: hypothetical protein IKI94_07215 [Ruminococcus sp.]|nr:hypothetical protein [Ruminococcus sp.]
MPNIITAKCPYCSYEFELDTEQLSNVCYCQSCGNKINIENDKIVPDTDSEEAKEIAKLNDEYKKSHKKWKNTSYVIILITIICSIIPFTLYKGISAFFMFIGIALVIFGPVAIALTEPDGSKIPNAKIRKPKRVLTAIKAYFLFAAFELIAIMLGLLLMMMLSPA